ncbi:hypothetical protein ASZ90_018803 [hydrocarbon metagenome]|uniref:Peptidase S8/S53 domain-containing protein n=1 Tax=hydrocarbon metagenome TaxID=938273 RepID=A0A0W8E546_9ZZZZ
MKYLKSSIIAIITLMAFVGSFFYTPATVADQEEGKSRIIVILDDGVSKKDIKDYVNKKGGKIKADFNIVNGLAVTLENDDIAGLKDLKGVKEVGPDVQVHASDIELDNSWGVKRIGAGTVHANNQGANINVAVIDTGIYHSHSDLNANYRGGYDFVNNDSDPLDDNGHGTHVAGIIAAEDDNSGVVGVAPQASLYALKVLDASGSGYVSNIILALDWCCTNGEIDVINMSLGAAVDAAGFHDAVIRAYEAGIVIVAAAGNSGKYNGKGDSIEYPARYEEVIAVGAVDSSDIRAYFSSTGPLLELAAPGVSILSCVPGGYGYKSGTSMASPYVAGTAALILAGNPGISPTSLRQLLRDTADELGPAGFDTLYGYGLVDADEAVVPAAAGSISGMVSNGTQGIGGATVTTGAKTVTSNADGSYAITGLAPGDYTVTASAEGYGSATDNAAVVSGQSTTLDFTLSPLVVENGSISGIVRNESSAGIPGVTVSCNGGTTLTGPDGSYNMPNVSPGNYTLTASADGYVDSPVAITVYAAQNTIANFVLTAVTEEQQIIVNNISYSTSGGKTGTAHLMITPLVTDSIGQAVPNALVSIEVKLNGSIYYTGSATTGTAGTVLFKLAAAPSGVYSTVVKNVQATGYVWYRDTTEYSYTK